MNCPECELLEMRVEKVENNEMYYKCKRCGKEIIVPIPEDEEQ